MGTSRSACPMVFRCLCAFALQALVVKSQSLQLLDNIPEFWIHTYCLIEIISYRGPNIVDFDLKSALTEIQSPSFMIKCLNHHVEPNLFFDIST